MIWEVEIRPNEIDYDRRRVAQEFDLLTHGSNGMAAIQATARGYLIEADLPNNEQRVRLGSFLGDDLVESVVLRKLGELSPNHQAQSVLTVLLKPGVMDPVSQSVLSAGQDLGLGIKDVRTFRRYYLSPDSKPSRPHLSRVLANDAIEQLIEGPLTLDHLSLGKP